MYGVVLWSDHDNGRALIWCEDHGNLAYFNAEKPNIASVQDFDEGDLVDFTVTEEREMRMARDIKVVASDEFPFLAQELREATRGGRDAPVPKPQPAKGNVVPFQPGPATADAKPGFAGQKKRASV